MTLSWPYAVEDFADLLLISQIKQRPGWNQQYSSQGSGGTLAADVAPAFREYDVICGEMPNEQAAEVMALIEALDGIVNSFYIYDPRKMYPAYDPDGSKLTGSTPTINTLNSNNRAMSLKGLPDSYQITRGDYLSWDYGSPSRRAYRRAAETVVANGSGVTPEFEVRDFLISGSIPDIQVTLIKPAMKAKMIAGSLQDNSVNSLYTQISFSIRQIL